MKDDLERFIQHNRDGFDNKTPAPIVLDRILEQMQPKKENNKPTGILIPFRVIGWAAASLILIAAGIVFLTLKKQPENITLVKTNVPGHEAKNPDDSFVKEAVTADKVKNEPGHKGIDAVDNDLAIRKQALAAKLKAQNVTSEKLVMFAGLRNMESPASRISAASAADRFQNHDNDVVDALVETLNSDPNANVRLAALDGLARFYQEKYVKRQLIASLKKQQDPVVQIAMINLLIRIKASGILAELDKIVNDENTQKAVKDCAYSGIFQLRSS